MKNPTHNGMRWLRQAKYDLDLAEKLLQDGNFAYACFFAEQSSQKSLKAFLIWRGERFVPMHSVAELAKLAASLDQAFALLIDNAKRLDRYYLSSRYPDALPEPAIPAESYTRAEAQDAVVIAREIYAACEAIVRME